MFPVACTAGNPFVLKPSEKTPGAALFLAKLANNAGLPEGVLNVVHGSVDVFQTLCDESAPQIRAISFVGSDSAGEAIYAMATATGENNYIIIIKWLIPLHNQI